MGCCTSCCDGSHTVVQKPSEDMEEDQMYLVTDSGSLRERRGFRLPPLGLPLNQLEAKGVPKPKPAAQPKSQQSTANQKSNQQPAEQPQTQTIAPTEHQVLVQPIVPLPVMKPTIVHQPRSLHNMQVITTENDGPQVVYYVSFGRDNRARLKAENRYQLMSKAHNVLTDNPHVVKLVSLSADSSRLHIRQQFCQFGSLRDLYQRVGPLSTPFVAYVTYILLTVLKELHEELDVPHGSLRASHLLVDKQLRLKVNLFNRKVGQQQEPTMRWVSPEGYCGEETTTSDIWSIGCLLIELLTGSLPFNWVKLPFLPQAVLRIVPNTNIACGGGLSSPTTAPAVNGGFFTDELMREPTTPTTAPPSIPPLTNGHPTDHTDTLQRTKSASSVTTPQTINSNMLRKMFSSSTTTLQTQSKYHMCPGESDTEELLLLPSHIYPHDTEVRDFILAKCLQHDPQKRASLDVLLAHPFLNRRAWSPENHRYHSKTHAKLVSVVSLYAMRVMEDYGEPSHIESCVKDILGFIPPLP